MISFFDEKCLQKLRTLPNPWRVPDAARAWATDCSDAQQIIERYRRAGWVKRLSSGHFRLTREGVFLVQSMLPGSDPPLHKRA